ncbi:MAG: CHAP domain-containing protein [Ruminococcus sp.]|nr:CHAP domain-containing protein [Ruminococcus sp.]MBQ2972514.1 CHAP domain-containing protein [Ruminococcus sp.]
MKKSISLLLAFIMVTSVFFAVPTFAVEKDIAEVGAPTQAEAINWLYSVVGKTQGDGWCVALVRAYYSFLGVTPISGNGSEYATKPLPEGKGWQKIPYSSSMDVEPGDIVVWSWTASGGSAGHVAIIVEDNANVLNAKMVTQHPGPPAIQKVSWAGTSIACVIRPKFGNTPHVHNYNTYVYYWASHPHYKCYKCSCGEVKENRNEPTYVASCTTCNHTHSYTTHSHYATEHPHYEYLKCSCGATQVNTSKTSLKDGCDQCYPATPVLNVRAGSDAEYVQFYWDAAKNTDEYELKIYDVATGERVSYPTGVTSLAYQVKLPAGDYIAYPVSIKNSLRETDRWWTSGAGVSFTVTTGEFKSSAESIVDGKRYELFNIAMPWTEAKAKCEELGGHLVTITSKEEADVVNSLVAKGGRTNYWLGLSDHETEGQWKSVTGESISYSNWGDDEPNNYLGLEDHATVIQDSFKWNDVMNMYGSYSLGFICEYENEVEELDVIIQKEDDGINFIFEELDDVAYYEFFDAEDGAQVEYTTTIEDYHNYVWKPIVQGKSIFTIEVRAYDSNDLPIGVSETMKLKVDVTEVEEWRMYGDLDHDNRVSVLDATKIQMHIAAINKFDKFEMIQADVDSDKRVSIIDATTIQRYIAQYDFASDIGKGCYCSGTLYDYTIAPKVESDWVLASSVPKDAEITDRKYTYTVTETTTSSSASMAGWTQTGYEWKEDFTNGAHSYANYPSGFLSSHHLYSLHSTTGAKSNYETETHKYVYSASQERAYIYWHWCRGATLSSPIDRKIDNVKGSEFGTFHAFQSNTNKSYNSSADAYQYSYPSCCKDTYWWYKIPVYQQTYTRYSKLYKYSKTTELESETTPSGSNISNVQEWVKYIYYA